MDYSNEENETSTREVEKAKEQIAGCAGCGLSSAVDEKEPSPHETTFSIDEITDDSVGLKCQTCGTRTFVPKDGYGPSVGCQSCGQEIPESLQGSHSCETHPLGTAADISFSPMENHR